MDRAMEDLDSALNELGMLSSSIKLTDYLKAMQMGDADVRRVRFRSGSVPGTNTRDTRDHEVTISVNSAYVTNIAVCPRTRTPPDMSSLMRRRLQSEAEERRTEDRGHSCDHRGHSSHICSFVSPRKNRSLRNAPYSLSPSFQNFSLRPSVSPLSGALSSSANKSLDRRLRGPVRFRDPGSVSQQSSLYPLDDDLTSKLSSIQLSSDSKISSQNPEGSSASSVASDLSNLSLAGQETSRHEL